MTEVKEVKRFGTLGRKSIVRKRPNAKDEDSDEDETPSGARRSTTLVTDRPDSVFLIRWVLQAVNDMLRQTLARTSSAGDAAPTESRQALEDRTLLAGLLESK